MASERRSSTSGRVGHTRLLCVSQFGERDGLSVLAVGRADDVRALLNRTFPKCVMMETGPQAAAEVLELCRSLKQDAFTAIVPVVVLVPADEPELAAESAGRRRGRGASTRRCRTGRSSSGSSRC